MEQSGSPSDNTQVEHPSPSLTDAEHHGKSTPLESNGTVATSESTGLTSAKDVAPPLTSSHQLPSVNGVSPTKSPPQSVGGSTDATGGRPMQDVKARPATTIESGVPAPTAQGSTTTSARADAGEKTSAVTAPSPSCAKETSTAAGSGVAASNTAPTATKKEDAGTEAKLRSLRASRFSSPVGSAHMQSGSAAGSHTHSNGAPASASAGKRGEGTQQTSASRRSSRSARVHGRRDNSRGTDGATFRNYFYKDESLSTFGVGTVGLFADKETSTHHGSRPETRGLSSMPQHRGVKSEEEGRQRSTESLAATAASPSDGSAAKGAHRSFPVSASYTAPALDGASSWERREESYQQWRLKNLGDASGYRHYKLPGVRKGAGAEGDANSSEPSPRSADRIGFVYPDKERERMERFRLRAIQAERAAKSSAREQERAAYEEEVLLLRMRKLGGEGVDLPDSYLRATYPDSSTLTGYAEAHHKGGRSRSGRSPHRSEAASGYLRSPLRVAKDHARAMQQNRQTEREVRLVREAQNQEASEQQRRHYMEDKSNSISQRKEYLASWMDGRPRISRSREAERRARHDAELRATSLFNRTIQARDRELYALYASEEAAADAARQEDLRVRVVCARPYTHRTISSRQRLSPKSQSSLEANAQHDDNGTSQFSKKSPHGTASARADNASPHQAMPTLSTMPRQTEAVRPMTATSRDTSPVPPPSQEAGATSRNFFNEVKEWSQTFPSPNLIPANGADPVYRRQWRDELTRMRVLTNRETAHQRREDNLRRLQEAREKTYGDNVKSAEQERYEKRQLAMRRADNTRADFEAATELRLELQEEAHRAQQNRIEQAEMRHNETQLQRQRSKQREVTLRSFEEEELNELRMMVSSASSAHR